MSTPDDKVYITEGKGEHFTYATASCQGWRRDQEDAEACIPDFDDDASLFILCDGHGGPEVAKYTVDHLPSFLKNHPFYKQGRYAEALEKAFIDFDAHLRKPETVAEVTKIAFDGEQEKERAESKDDNDSMDVGTSGCPSVSNEAAGSSGAGNSEAPTAGPSASGSSSGAGSSSAGPSASSSTAGPSTSNGASTVADDVDADTLRREAKVPIDELIHKYSDEPGTKDRLQSIRKANLNLNASPVIKSKDDQEAECKEEKESNDQEAFSSNSGAGQQAEPSSSKSADEGPSSTSGGSKGEPKTALDIFKKAMEKYFDENDDDSEDDSEFEGSEETDSDEDEDDDDDDGEDEDEEDEDEDDDDEDEDGDDERDEEQQGEKNKIKKLLRKKQRKLAAKRGDVSSSNDDSDDYEDSTTDDEDDEDEDEDEDGDEEEFHNIVSIPQRVKASLKAASKIHKPVFDSGCTVVVALAKGNKLYVGSAGDSRCILIMRDGQCKPMSFDHKPEDPVEHRRIQRAGGQVIEGRVNGGLNLSRALGDFTYKGADLEARDQMITPCPDVRTAELDPEQVEYIFLACDGIWNSMKNSQATKFIRKVAPTVDNDLVQICTAVFKNCLAPGTDGDGTGCDNMTCILARYISSSERDSSKTIQSDLNTLPTTTNTSATTNEVKEEDKLGGDIKGANKRLSDEESGNGPMNLKRRCLRLLED